MVSRYPIILSFILATLVAVGSVELLYYSLNKILTPGQTTHSLPEEKVSLENNEKAASSVEKTNTASQVQDYTIITRRNIFGAPQSDSSLTSRPQRLLATTPLELSLLGTVGGEGRTQRAIIRNKNDGKEALYAAGDTIEQATIKEINRGQIILTLNGEDQILLMEEMKSPPTTARSVKKQIVPEPYALPNAVDEESEEKSTEEPTESKPSTPTTTPIRKLTL